LKEAETYFEKISKKYGITPTSEHHTCMVVGFGCAGHFGKALSIIKSMPCFMEPSVWLRVLGSCKKWGNMKLGKLAFGQARQLDDDLSAAQIGKYQNHAFITFGIDNSLTHVQL
jgi:pentatricopeptide repeat protein